MAKEESIRQLLISCLQFVTDFVHRFIQKGDAINQGDEFTVPFYPRDEGGRASEQSPRFVFVIRRYDGIFPKNMTETLLKVVLG